MISSSLDHSHFRLNALSTGNSPFINRVKKRAFTRTLETTTVEDIDDPSASPEVVAKSPMSHSIYQSLSNRINEPTGAECLSDYHTAMPESDSQGACLQLKFHLDEVYRQGKKGKKN